MEYDYESLSRQFNLERAEIERVMTEAREAFASLERNHHLLNQHKRLAMRLQEIKTCLALTDSRINELKLSQRIARIELEAFRAEAKEGPSEGNLEALRRTADSATSGAADSGEQFSPGSVSGAEFEQLSPRYRFRQMDYLNRIMAQVENEWRTQRRSELTSQHAVFQLELVELLSQKVRLEKDHKWFETELARTEHQLQLNGIGPSRGSLNGPL